MAISPSLTPAAAMPLLLVDDNVDAVYSQAVLLRSAGFEVLTATHGDDVLPLIEAHHPRALLLDLKMPGTDGFTIAECLKQRPDLRPQLLIALTGLADQESRNKIAEAGFDYYFLKPARWSELLEVLRGRLSA